MARNKKRISKRTRNRLIFAGGVIVVLLLLFLLIRAYLDYSFHRMIHHLQIRIVIKSLFHLWV